MLNWKAKNTTYEAYLGSVKVMEVFQFPGLKGIEYRIQTFLPGTHEYRGGFETQGVAMKRAEAILKEWLRATNLGDINAKLFN